MPAPREGARRPRAAPRPGGERAAGPPGAREEGAAEALPASPGAVRPREPERRAAPPYLACFPASAPVPHAIEPVPGLPSPLWAA